jgi:hypothetical protein
MSSPVIRTTYALDAPTVLALREVAERWGVSRSEALRRIIREAARTSAPVDRARAFESLQAEAALSPRAAAAWADAVQAERAAQRSPAMLGTPVTRKRRGR